MASGDEVLVVRDMKSCAVLDSLHAASRGSDTTWNSRAYPHGNPPALQLDEGNRNMAKVAHMVDLRPLPRGRSELRLGNKDFYHRDMIEKVVNVERTSISAYVTCGRDGRIKFWHKDTFAHMRSINHLDTVKDICSTFVLGGKSWDQERDAVKRSVFYAPTRRAVASMERAWMCDIEQMPLGNRIAAACLDRTVCFYDMLTGDFVCRIAGLRFPPTCVACPQVGSIEQQVIFGDSEGHLHVWTLGENFYIPGREDPREAAEVNGNFSKHLHAGAVCHLAYVTDIDAAVTCGVDGKVRFFDLVKRRLLRTFEGHGDRAVFSFAYCTRHRFFVSVGIGREVVFWNPYTMCILAKGEGHAANVRHCVIDEESNRVITVSADKTVRCWDSTTFRCVQIFKESRTHRPEDTITATLWDEGRRSLILAGNTLGVWKNSGAIHVSTRSHEGSVTAALYNKHFQQIVSGDAMGNVHVWMVETGQIAFRYVQAHGACRMTCIYFDESQRRLLTGANDGRVKLWNFSNGTLAENVAVTRHITVAWSSVEQLYAEMVGRPATHELQLFDPGSRPRGPIEECNEVLGLVCFKDNRGSEGGVENVVTCSWDKQVRVYSLNNAGNTQSFRPPGAGVGNALAPSRIFSGEHCQQQGPREDEENSERRTGAEDGSRSADISCVALCGEEQVATGAIDGHITVWATDSGTAKFEMRPYDYDISHVDEVSSVGGLTSVATRMEHARKQGLVLADGRTSVDSFGYLDRMKDLLAEDASQSKVSWDGREFFAEERMGGSDNGSGTTAAARGIEAALRENEEEEQSGADAMDRADDTNKTVGDIPPKTTNTEETVSFARSEAALCSRKEENFTSHDDVAVGEAEATMTATALTSEPSMSQTDLYGDDISASQVVAGVAAPMTCDGGGEARRTSSRSKMSDSEPGSTASGPQTSPHLASTKVQDESGTKCRGSTERTKNVEGPQGEEELSRKRSGSASKAGAGAEEKDAGVAQLLGRDTSRSVDCLMHIKCHDILVSGTASGELHFWDGPTGAFIFGTLARHPHGGGLSAMGSSEGISTAAIDLRAVIGGSGNGGGGSNGVVSATDAPEATPATPAIATVTVALEDSANLVLYTACDRGFVKTWRVGDFTEHVCLLGLRARSRPARRNTSNRSGKRTKISTTGATPGAGGVEANAGGYHCDRGTTRKSLLQPVRQWQAHETAVTSVEGGNFHGKLELLVTAGVDCYVHLWTAAGAHIGAFGQSSGLWSLGSRATWRKPAEQTLLSSRKLERRRTAGDQSTLDPDDDGPKGTGDESMHRRSRTVENKKLGLATSEEDGGGGSVEREQNRYYAASEAKMQRKLLRGQIADFCSSQDVKDNLKEVSYTLKATAIKNAFHPPASPGLPGLGKSRIASILRSTYNQVSFQLHLHEHEDVHKKAEGTLARRKARRKVKSSALSGHRDNNSNKNNSSCSYKNANTTSVNSQHRNRNGRGNESRLVAQLPNEMHPTTSSYGVEMTGVFPMTMSAPTAADIDSTKSGACIAGDRRGLTPMGRGPYQSSCSDIGNVRYDFEGVDGTIGPAAAGGKQNALVSPPYDHIGDVRPAAPVCPPSSGAEVGRRFRRAHTTGSAGKG